MLNPQTGAALSAREATISELRKRLCRIACALTDEELVKPVDAIVRARRLARVPHQPPEA